MKRIVALGFATMLMSIVLYVSACKKTAQDPVPSTGIANEANEAQNEWDDILGLTEEAMYAAGKEERLSDTSPTIDTSTIAEGNYIGEIVIDFGTGITGYDGKVRSGQIIVKYTGKYLVSGSIIQCTTNNYFVNGRQILGCRMVKNINGKVFSVKDSGSTDSTGAAKVIYSDGKFTTWTADLQRTWTGGYTTPDLTDDVFSISGTAQGSSRDVLPYKMNISSLILQFQCYLTYFIYIPSGGSISVSYPDGIRSIDFGNGSSCDNDVVYTHTDGKKYEVSL